MHKTNTALCFNFAGEKAATAQSEVGIWLPMLPAGLFSGRDGRTWINDQPEQVLAAFDQKIPFDIEHATELKDEAPAVGWVTKLENRDGQIWGLVEWNQEGEWHLQAKRFAFYSPSFYFDSNGRISKLSSVGLTNRPNLYVPALNREETQMPLPVELTQALGLGADADTASALTAINTLKADHQLAMNRANAGPDLNKFVPKETYELALNRATTAEAKVKETEEAKLAALVDEAITAGKIAPANKEMFLGMCRAEGGVEQFKAFVQTAPVIADADKLKNKAPAAVDGLTENQLAMCRKMKIAPEQYLASLKQIEGAQ
jgi:phage I-like protein